MTAPTTAALEARLAEASAPNGNAVAHVDALVDLAWHLRMREVRRAHELAAKARELAQEHEYTLGQARATRTMLMTMVDSPDLQQALTLAEEAKQLFDEADDPGGRAGSRDFLASIHEHLGNLNAGLDYALDALEIARELGDPVRQGYALSSVGGILAQSGEVDAAIDRLTEALSLFEQVEDPGGVCAICTRLSRVHRENNNLDEAFGFAERARVGARAASNNAGEWGATTAMAEVEESRGRLDEAERLYRLAFNCLPTASSYDVLGSETHVSLARLYIKTGRLDEAETELKHAVPRVENNPLTIVTEAEMQETFADLYERLERFFDALTHLRKAKALRERIAQQDTQNKLAQLEARAAIDAAQKDAEIHRLRFVELHEAQAKLVEAEKMALMGKLAAGTAHELNTPLGVLRSHVGLVASATERLLEAAGAARKEPRLAKLAAALADGRVASESAIDRIAAIATRLLRFTQLDQAKRRPFDLAESFESTLRLVEPPVADRITFERRLQPVPTIDGWPQDVNFALMTILENAVEAIDTTGTIVVEASVDDDGILARISDSGRGMTAEQVDHLFDVGWSEGGPRTKMRLGLLAAHATMQQHEGHIHVISKVGQGTTITLWWPLSK